MKTQDNNTRGKDLTRKISSVILAVIASVILLVLLMGLYIFLVFNKITATGTLSEIVMGINFADLNVATGTVENIAEGKELFEPQTVGNKDNVDTLVSEIYKALKEHAAPELLDKYSVDEKKIKEIISDSTLKEFLAEKAEEYNELFKTGKSDYSLSSEGLKNEIVEFVRANYSCIRQVLGDDFLLTDKDYQEVYDYFDNNQEVFDSLDSEQLYSKLTVGDLFIPKLLSTEVLVLYICFTVILFVAFAVALGFLRDKYLAAAPYYSIAFLISGIAVLVLCSKSVISSIVNIEPWHTIAIEVFKQLKGLTLTFGIATIVIGLILCTTHAIIKLKSRKAKQC